MYSATSKEKLEAAATIAAVVFLAVAPPTALAAIERHEARRSRPQRPAADRAAGRTSTADISSAR